MTQHRKVDTLMKTGYFVTYFVRNCYVAVLVAIISDMQISKELASGAITGAFFSYGLGQVVSGRIGDRFHPYKIVLLGFLATSLLTLSVSFTTNIMLMNLLWTISGFCHSLFWPAMTRICTGICKGQDDFNHLVGKINQFAYIGQIVIYLFASVFVAYFHWRMLFVMTGCLSLIYAGIWFVYTRNLPFIQTQASTQNQQTPRLTFKNLLAAGLIPIVLATCSIGFIRDGINTWIPLYFSEIFHLDKAVSLLTTILMPISGIFFITIAEMASKKIQNEFSSAAIFAGSSAFFALILFLFFGKSGILDLVLIGLISCCVRGCSMPIVCYLPYAFDPYGAVATASGLIDGIVYMGSALASYVLASIADNFGWSANIGTWFLVTSICTLCCVLAIKPWMQFSTVSRKLKNGGSVISHLERKPIYENPGS